MIASETAEVLTCTDFLESDRTMVRHILKMNSLSCTEAELFDRCMAWVKIARKQDQLTREHVMAELGESFFEFRFGCMSANEFIALVPRYGSIFSSEDYQEILLIIGSPEFEPKKFNRNRQARTVTDQFKVLQSVLCDRLASYYCSYNPYYIKKIETMAFSTNEVLILSKCTITTSFTFLNSIYKKTERPLPIQVKVVRCPRSGSGERKKLLYKGNSTDFSANPMLIQPGFIYEIQTKMLTKEKICSGAILRRKVKVSPGITVQFHRDPIVGADDAARGIYYSLTFLRI